MGITYHLLTTPTTSSTTTTTTMAFKIAVILALAAVVSCRPNAPAPYSPPSYSAPAYKAPAYSDAAPAYQYDYAVKDDYSGVDFGHNEARDGYNTHGSYYVALPDGRLQRVTYTVNGDEGYVAEVTYEGEATYPDHKPAYKAAPAHHKPSYHPAPAPYQPAPYHA